jgi:hypothetical protein
MKKLAGLNFFTVLLILSVAPILFPGPGQAYVYDDFTSPGINPNLWVDTGPNSGLFSQPGDGYLYFNDASGGKFDKLQSNRVSGPFFVSMLYSNFQTNNNQPAGQASAVQLGLGDGSNGLYMVEGKNSYGNFFQAISVIGGIKTLLQHVLVNVNSGRLGIRYNGILGSGGKIDFLYNSGAGWMVLDSCAPNFSQAPYFSIWGYDYYGSSLSFQVDQVQVTTPNPSPTINLLLE